MLIKCASVTSPVYKKGKDLHADDDDDEHQSQHPGEDAPTITLSPWQLLSAFDTSSGGSVSSAPYLLDMDDEEYYEQYSNSKKNEANTKESYFFVGLPLGQSEGLTLSAAAAPAVQDEDLSCSNNNPVDQPQFGSSLAWMKVGIMALIGATGLLLAFAVGQMMGERRSNLMAHQRSRGLFYYRYHEIESSPWMWLW
jgi:hypothetical protein